ncbi:hypothetical protein L1049_008851 [Liquidambar formosana]|uniref:Uncharacterized protein n=1 Tax=Liquidambar formosana TaxID=63359 RepID=A0AAP0X5X8_LIQFO
MIRVALKISRAARTSGLGLLSHRPSLLSSPPPTSLRSIHDEDGSCVTPLPIQMIDYSISQARNKKSVAAVEALVGLHLELGQDDTSSVLADKCLQRLRNNGSGYGSEVLNGRAKAVKGLVQLVHGNLEAGCNLTPLTHFGEISTNGVNRNIERPKYPTPTNDRFLHLMVDSCILTAADSPDYNGQSCSENIPGIVAIRTGRGILLRVLPI